MNLNFNTSKIFFGYGLALFPLLLLIGWRGSPRQPDEPQHKAKGKITTKLLKLLNINFCILRKEKDLLKIKNLL